MLISTLIISWVSIVNITLILLVINLIRLHKDFFKIQEELAGISFALQDLDDAVALLEKKVSKRSPAAQRFYENKLTNNLQQEI